MENCPLQTIIKNVLIIRRLVDISKIETGDNQEIKFLVRSISSWTYHTVYGFLKNHHDTEEVIQDVALKVLDKLMSADDNGKFKGESSLKTWVYSIALNRTKDVIKWKNQKKRAGNIISISEDGSSKDGQVKLRNHNNPIQELEQKEDFQRLWDAILDLPPKQKEALILTKIDRNSMKEASVLMNTSPKAIESLVSRAKANLNKLLDR